MTTYTIPGAEPPAEVEWLQSTNKNWTLSRDNECWVLEHHETGIIDAGPVLWDDLKHAYCGEMRDITAQIKKMVAATWDPESGEKPPSNVGFLRLMYQGKWWVTK